MFFEYEVCILGMCNSQTKSEMFLKDCLHDRYFRPTSILKKIKNAASLGVWQMNMMNVNEGRRWFLVVLISVKTEMCTLYDMFDKKWPVHR